MLWRMIRAAKSDQVDFFSEKGLLDYSNIPLLGMFDDHKDDVMPDYMAKTMGFGKGLGAELSAAILTDPLVYMTGGLTGLGKGARAITRLTNTKGGLKSGVRAVNEAIEAKVKQQAGKQATQRWTDTDDFLRSAKVDDLDEILKSATLNLAGKTDEVSRGASKNINKAQKVFANLTSKERGMKLDEILKFEGNRKLALGLPGLAALGLKIPVPGTHQSWFKLFANNKGTASVGAGMAWATRHIASVPWVGAPLRAATAIPTQFAGGWRVGVEAQTAIKDAAKNISNNDFGVFRHALDSHDGGGTLIPHIIARGKGTILKDFDNAIEAGKSIEEAFIKSVGKLSNRKDTPAQVWARLTGNSAKGAKKTGLPTGVEPHELARARTQLSESIEKATVNYDEANKLFASGEYNAKLVATDTSALAEALKGKREALGQFIEPIGELSFAAGRSLRKTVNLAFKTGTTVKHGQNAMNKFLSDVAATQDQVQEWGKGIYQELKKVVKGMPGWTEDDFATMVSHIMEGDALADEIIESISAIKMNPSEGLDIAEKLLLYVDRHRTTLDAMEKVLSSKGATDSIRKNIMRSFKTELGDWLPRFDKELLETYGSTYDDMLEVGSKTEQKLTVQQRIRMKRRHNAHVVKGGKFKDQNVGYLSNDEIRSAIDDIENAATRKLTPDEIVGHIDESPVLKGFMDEHGLTHEQVWPILQRTGKAKHRIIRQTKLAPTELWSMKPPGRKRTWTTGAAKQVLGDYGLTVIKHKQKFLEGLPVDDFPSGYYIREQGVKGPSPLFIKQPELPQRMHTVKGPKPPNKLFMKTYGSVEEALADSRRWLKRNKRWREKHGPGPTPVKADITVKASVAKLVRDQLSREDKLILAGKATKFDEIVLREEGPRLVKLVGDGQDRTFLKRALDRRELTKEKGFAERTGGVEGQRHILYEDQVVPEEIITRETITPPRIIRKGEEEGRLGLQGKEALLPQTGKGKVTYTEWSRAYARNMFNLDEVIRFLKKAADEGIDNPTIPFELLDEISTSMMEMGSKLNGVVMDHLPKRARDLFKMTRTIQGRLFTEAKRSGAWIPGATVGYMGRFFTSAAKQRVGKILGEIDGADETILMRLGMKVPSRHSRNMDNLTIDDLNEVYTELRQGIAAQNENSAKWMKEIDRAMEEEGFKVMGYKGTLPWSNDRLNRDPFLSILINLGHAQQGKTLEDYFSTWLKAGKLKDGNSLVIGGKVVDVLDAEGKSIKRVFAQVDETVQQGTPTKTIRPVEKNIKDVDAKYIIIKDDDGVERLIHQGTMVENGFSLLPLGVPAKAAGFEDTVAKSFVQASMRSDLHNNMIRSEHILTGKANLNDLLGQHVVFGAENIVVGGVKTASKTLEVTPAAMRTFDNINHWVKSFQTVFRLPFHIYNLTSGVFQGAMAGIGPKNLMAGYGDTFRLLWGNNNFLKHNDLMLSMIGAENFTTTGSHFLPRLDLMTAIKRNFGDTFSNVTEKELRAVGLDRVDDMVLHVGGGREIHMSDFISAAADGQLFSSFASSMRRGSRTVPDALMRIKMEALDPTAVKNMGHRALGKAIEKLGGRPGELREVSEAINRTATAMGLIREGHSIERAVQMSKMAHVPYERLTPFERNFMKRAFLYYSFPRHYMPWAWARFAEDPSKLASLAQTIKNKRMITTDEGRAHLKLGDYRVDLGRANANVEAAMLIGSFQDNFTVPLGRLAGVGPSKMYPEDPNVLTRQLTDAGIASLGGVFGAAMGGGRFLPQSNRSAAAVGNSWNEARRMVWPIKLGLMAMNKLGFTDMGLPTKEEASPYVNYTPMEKFIADTDWGFGIRKVRKNHEFRRAQYEYQRVLRRLKLRMAATPDTSQQDKLRENIQVITESLQSMAVGAQQEGLLEND